MSRPYKPYIFRTVWQVEAPLPEVWKAVLESLEWPGWWENVRSVREVRPGDEKGIGSIRTYIFRTPAGYPLHFHMSLQQREEYRLLYATVSGGLEGTGAWHFSEKQGISTAICIWEVEPAIPWMKFWRPFLAPFFRYNHQRVMQRGLKSLKKLLTGS